MSDPLLTALGVLVVLAALSTFLLALIAGSLADLVALGRARADADAADAARVQSWLDGQTTPPPGVTTRLEAWRILGRG